MGTRALVFASILFTLCGCGGDDDSSGAGGSGAGVSGGTGGSGWTLLPAPYDVDVTGTKRGADGVWDIGAYEYAP